MKNLFSSNPKFELELIYTVIFYFLFVSKSPISGENRNNWINFCIIITYNRKPLCRNIESHLTIFLSHTLSYFIQQVIL